MAQQRELIFPPKLLSNLDWDKETPVNLSAFSRNWRSLTKEQVEPVIQDEVKKTTDYNKENENIFIDRHLNKMRVSWNMASSFSSKASQRTSAFKKSKPLKCDRCTKLEIIKKANFEISDTYSIVKLKWNAQTAIKLRVTIQSCERLLKERGVSEEEIKRVRDVFGVDDVEKVECDHLVDPKRMHFKHFF